MRVRDTATQLVHYSNGEFTWARMFTYCAIDFSHQRIKTTWNPAMAQYDLIAHMQNTRKPVTCVACIARDLKALCP